MNSIEFSCEKHLIEALPNIVQRNILIFEYCGQKFYFFNYIMAYYRTFEQNIRLMLIFVVSLLVFFVLLVRIASRKCIAQPLLKTKREFGLSSIIVSTFLSPAIYKLNLVINNDFIGGTVEDNFWILCILMSFCIALCTVQIALLFYQRDKDIVLPAYVVRIDLISVGLAMVIFTIFGLRRKINFLFPTALIFVYLGNFFFKYRANKRHSEERSAQKASRIEAENEARVVLTAEREKGFINDIQADYLKRLDDDVLNIHSKIEAKSLFPPSRWDLVQAELFEPNVSIFRSIICLPFSLLLVLAVPFPSNPLRTTLYKYVLATLSVGAFFAITTRYNYIPFYYSAVVGLAAGLIILGLDLLSATRRIADVLLDLISVFGAMSALKLIEFVSFDLFEFIGFYYNLIMVVQYAITTTYIISTTDIFANIYITNEGGKKKFGFLASYSSSAFALLFAMAVFSIYELQLGNTRFILFNEILQTQAFLRIDPRSRKYFKYVMIVTLLIIFITLSTMSKSTFVINQKLSRMLTVCFLTFTSISLGFSFFS